MSRHKNYSGILAKPLELAAPADLRLDRPHRLYTMMGLPEEDWRRVATELIRRDAETLIEKRRALCSHFGIDPADDDADIDLALELAYRHERSVLLNDGSVRLRRVRDRHKVAKLESLWCVLACAHVPGFQISEQPVFESRLSTTDLVKIFFARFAVEAHLRQSGDKPTDRKIARILLDPVRLKAVIPERAAKGVQDALRRSANCDRNSERALKSRDRAVRLMLAEERMAWVAFKSGRASQFHLKMIAEVWPILHRILADQSGQKRPAEIDE